jgi:uncharacterized protein
VIRIAIDSIPDGSSHIELVEDARELEMDPDSGIASFESPVSLDLNVMRSDGEIVLTGTAGVDVTFDCARCLKRYGARLEAPLSILCLLGDGAGGYDGDENSESVVRVAPNSRFIDITGEVRSELMVDLPVKPLCSDDCKGLCPMCGADLNETTCSCRSDEHDSRWDALKKLK